MGALEGLDTRLLVDLLRDRVNPSKSLGQHYLVDDEVIERTIRLTEEFQCPLSGGSHVLEVGPGPGSLDAFVKACNGETFYEGAGPHVGLKAVATIEAIYRSAQAGGPVEVSDGCA